MPTVISMERAITAPINLVKSSYCTPILPHVNDDSIFIIVLHEVLLTNSYDSGDYILYGINEIVDYASKISQLTTGDVKLLLSNSCDYELEHPINYKLNYYIAWTFVQIILDNHPANASWNPLADQALFLMGKAEKIHRVGLLAKLYERKLLDRVKWSFRPNDSVKAMCKEILWNYSDYNFNKFLAKCVRDLDPIKTTINIDSTFHYLGFPYDVKMYENTCLSIISETEFHRLPAGYEWITEKTWRAIANRHPFVIASSPGTLARLKSYGFRTFENYMLDPDYDQISDESARLEAIATNVGYFMNTYRDHIDSITADVEHNFQLFNRLAREEILKLQSFLNNNKNNSNYSEKDTTDMLKKIDFRISGPSQEMLKFMKSL
jgi:hypothetical protein